MTADRFCDAVQVSCSGLNKASDGDPSWACGVCGEVHPSDHVALWCRCGARFCASCEQRSRTDHDCPGTGQPACDGVHDDHAGAHRCTSCYPRTIDEACADEDELEELNNEGEPMDP